MAERDVVELRVHGVSGTPAAELLDRAQVYRLAGDATAGFYRPGLAAESTDGTWAPLQPGANDGPQLEGYAWGGLTSGAPSRAFWLLLLPFTLVNVSPRLRPPIPAERDDVSRSLVRLTWYLTRVLGLALTVLFVLAVAGIGDDLIGWQCGQGPRCAQANPQWFARLVFGVSRAGPNRHGLSAEHRLAVGTVIPLVIVAGLWLISRATVNRYETVTVSGSRFDPAGADGHGVAGEVALDSRWMWQNTALVRRLGAVHVQAGLATALWVVAGPLERSWQIHRVGQLGVELYGHPFGLLAALVILRGVVVFAVPSFSSHQASTFWHRMNRGVWALLAVGWAAIALRLLFAHRAVDAAYLRPTGRTPVGGLPGYSASVLGLFLFEVCTLVALAAVLSIAHWRVRHRPDPMTKGNAHKGFLGFGSLVLATTGMFLASVFAAGEYLSAAGWLHTGSIKPSFHDLSMVPTVFHLPEVIKLAALAYTLSVIGLGLAVVAGVVWYLAAARMKWYGLVDVEGFKLDYPPHDIDEDGADEASVRARRKTILQAYFAGRLVDFAGNSLLALVAFGAAISTGLSLILFGEHVWPMGWARRAARWLSDSRTATHASVRSSIPGLEVVGAYLTVLTIVLMVILGALAFRVPATRRSVGILWDIASFWPRTAHPLAAPCYAERTVPDLITRIRWYREGPARSDRVSGPGEPTGVVLAGHSQGTVISCAALIQLAAHTPQRPPAGPERAPDDVLPGLAFLTFGCVLRRLYGRYFPVYFGAPVIDRLARQLGGTHLRPGRWLNLWRYTDYLGGRVTTGPPPQTEPPDVEQTASAAPVREEHVRDPAFFGVQPGDTVPGRPLRHSDFWKSPDGSFQSAVAELADQV